MKLFSPVQAKNSSTTKQLEDIEEVVYLEKTIRSLREQTNKETEQFDSRMKEQRKLYTEEKNKLQQELLELQDKIKDGERRLIQTLIPITGLKDRAEAVLSEYQVRAVGILTREEENNELYESLTTKLDELSERETDLDLAEQRLTAKQLRIQDEEDSLIARKEVLNKQLLGFIEKTSKKELELVERENKVKAIERMNQEYIDTRTKDLDEQERALRDKREALDRAFSEITRLKQK